MPKEADKHASDQSAGQPTGVRRSPESVSGHGPSGNILLAVRCSQHALISTTSETSSLVPRHASDRITVRAISSPCSACQSLSALLFSPLLIISAAVAGLEPQHWGLMQVIGNFGDPRAAWVHAGQDITPEPLPAKHNICEVGDLHSWPRKRLSYSPLTNLDSLTLTVPTSGICSCSAGQRGVHVHIRQTAGAGGTQSLGPVPVIGMLTRWLSRAGRISCFYD